ncbi:hypothetical protein [Clostridium oryzae]|uniref:Uncharacterized protein n=1 Tax=Clostridium oryzae TaxID=1450648 RepID=A0A1V4IHW5_9CLOT|nr:hypothetical protein [Clostridium oryzae]OPJ59592.1 hypothetical protein CLORY_32400 [Clostridium oryzae]
MKQKIKVSLLVILVLTISIIAFLFIRLNAVYTEIIKINWNIKLPMPYKQIYSIDSGPSFHGDGERYHIFKYKNEVKLSRSVDWYDDKNKSVEASAKKVLLTLGVSKYHAPNFKHNYKYFVKYKNKNSKMYLIFDIDTRKLYVIENII